MSTDTELGLDEQAMLRPDRRETHIKCCLYNVSLCGKRPPKGATVRILSKEEPTDCADCVEHHEMTPHLCPQLGVCALKDVS